MDPRRSTALRHLEYNAWATQKVLDSVQSLSAEELNRDMQTSHSSILGTLNHTFQADALWLKRLQGDSGAKLDGIASVAELANLRTAWSHVQGDFLSWAGGLVLVQTQEGDRPGAVLSDELPLSGQRSFPDLRYGRSTSSQLTDFELIFLDLLRQLDSSDHDCRSLKAFQPQHRPKPLLHAPMVLLDHRC